MLRFAGPQPELGGRGRRRCVRRQGKNKDAAGLPPRYTYLLLLFLLLLYVYSQKHESCLTYRRAVLNQRANKQMFRKQRAKH